MAVRVRLLAPGASKELHAVPSQFLPDEQVLVTTTVPQHHGVFRSRSRTSAGTSTIADPDEGGAIVLTDLIVSTDRVANSTITVQFTDGTLTITLLFSSAADGPVNLATSFVGLWRGWMNARLELETTQTLTATVVVGFMKVPNGLPFSAWDALR